MAKQSIGQSVAAPPSPRGKKAPSLAGNTDTPSPTAVALSGKAPRVFTVSHLKEADFKADGLRAYAYHRDLEIAAAKGGLCQAHVIRMMPPCTDEVGKPHRHRADLRLLYVFKGAMKNAFDGHGEQMMFTGSCWLQPSGIRHTVLDYSAHCEALEIVVPAAFGTEEVA